MRLLYKVEKRGDDWKIIEMPSVFEADELQPIIAGTDFKTHAEDVEGLRISYRWLAYVRMKSGDKINADLLGVDRPNDIERIYAESIAWLNQSRK